LAKAASPADPVREKLRAKVAGPAIGLIVAGVLGLSPLLVALLVVPAVTVPHILRQGRPGMYVPPPSFLPILLPQSPGAAIAAQRVSLVPPLLAQRSDFQVALWLPFAAILSLIVSFAQSVTLIVGGWQMRKLRSYGLVLVAAVLAVVPCTFAWIIGLPMGIWALVVLMDPEVKAGFES
jgi:hypothetical protein